MSDADFEELCRYLRAIADDLALRDWTIVVKREPAETGANAQVRPIVGRKLAELRFAWDFRDDLPERQRHTVVHELLHLHFASAQHAIEFDLAKHHALNDHEHEIIWQSFLRQFEYGIDGIADGVAERFPLIAWPLEVNDSGSLTLEKTPL